ncbi:ATP-binding protein [Luteolibacter luteus]|uniref:histidine kinase n=1 Tax=Luteolibacter luteus TaxID=2728835 RepID=A0A858RHQ9_9BACT|nr:ATP-binding protein [Luteolibacter luteus]QJE96245.1 HAMP domain-containing protein [Luteolibacter luteus]
MLRTRLFFGLLTLILLLWGVGAAALLLVRDASKRYDTLVQESYPAIKLSRGFRTITTGLNVHYLPALASPPGTQVPDRSKFDADKEELKDRVNALRLQTSSDGGWDDLQARLDQAVETYLQGYERFFAESLSTQEDRSKLMSYMSTQTQRITDLSDSIFALADAKMMGSSVKSGAESSKNTFFVLTLVLLGTGIAMFIYFQLVRHMVDPVVGLRRSIEEIRKGNFELTLPEPGADSEFRSVATAFNDMAAELRVRRGETNERLLKTNLVNRAILEAIPSPVFVLGDDGRILQINPAAERLTESLGVAGRLPSKIQRILNESNDHGENHLPEDPREALLFRIEEREFFYLPRIFSFTSEDGVYSGRAVLLHNVTRIRWLDDMKTNLISTVSHEIKTPLTGIRMVLHLLLEERSGGLTDVQKTMVSSANDDCERLLVTLNTLLDLSRSESGSTHLERVPVALRDAMLRAERIFEPRAAEKSVEIDVEAADGMPEVSADPLRLDEVLNNLVSNAIKHSPTGGKVTLRASQPDAEHMRVTVIDQGPGVPEEMQNRIFERFFRAPGQDSDGVGLGLFICREIMRAHEGRIGLKERAHDQTEFFIDVPIA